MKFFTHPFPLSRRVNPIESLEHVTCKRTEVFRLRKNKRTGHNISSISRGKVKSQIVLFFSFLVSCFQVNELHLTSVVRLMTVDPSGITFLLRRPFHVNDEAIFPASQYISFRSERSLITAQHRLLMTYFASYDWCSKTQVPDAFMSNLSTMIESLLSHVFVGWLISIPE